MPVQLVVAGKAHPQDNPGKDVMQQIVELAREHSDRIVFLEDYDIGLAQTIIPGVDVWLNNPTRPLEASGTSGMKAAVNGVPNLSVLDGWWPEGYDPEVGWAIDGVSDEADLQQLYTLLENEVVPDLAGPRPLAADDDRVDLEARAAVLDAPRRDRVRRALLPARRERLATPAPTTERIAAPLRRRA